MNLDISKEKLKLPEGRECTICKIYKLFSEFQKCSTKKFGYQNSCRECRVISQKNYVNSNKEKIYSKIKEYRKLNAEEIQRRDRIRQKSEKRKETARQWRIKNKERMIEKRKISYLKQRDKYLDNAYKRYALKLKAIPPWVEFDKISQIYKEARLLTKTTSIKYVVDHIIPLRGKTVTGLHIHTNLRIITFEENARKSNKLLEDIL